VDKRTVWRMRVACDLSRDQLFGHFEGHGGLADGGRVSNNREQPARRSAQEKSAVSTATS